MMPAQASKVYNCFFNCFCNEDIKKRGDREALCRCVFILFH